MDKKLEKHFRFPDNYIWIGSGKFSQSWTKYLPSAINVLTVTPKNSPDTRGRILQINFNENGEKHVKRDLMGIWNYLGRFHILCLKTCSETGIFREVSNEVFHSL